MSVNDLKINLAAAVGAIKSELKEKRALSNKRLLDICRNSEITVHEPEYRIHDLLETAVNIHLREIIGELNTKKIEDLWEQLKSTLNLLPTQSWRDREQIELQQFSTPHEIALIMTSLLKPAGGETVLEPSAGTGSLATWLKIAGCRVEVNEISNRRRQLLELQNFKPHKVNAEFIDDLLDEKIKPEGILMNPPFSAALGRTKNAASFGFRHVESALRRLNHGGRLVCLLGSESSLQTARGKEFWEKISFDYDLRTFIRLPANAFYKQGTTFKTVIIVIDKPEKEIKPHRATKIPVLNLSGIKELLTFAEHFA